MYLMFFSPRENRYSINALIGALEEFLIEQKIDVKVCYKEDELLEMLYALPHRALKVVVISFFTTQFWDMEGLVKGVKKAGEVRIIAGGPHPTGMPRSVLKMGVDYVVRGEGEYVLNRLLQSLINAQEPPEIRGLCYKGQGGEVIDTGLAEPVDLNRYRPWSVRFKRFGPVEITRGCPFGCHYCQTPRIFRGGIRHRSVEMIEEAVKERMKRGLGDIRFITPNALSYGSKDGKTVNLEAIEELLKRIRAILGKRGRIFFGSFPSEVRPEQITEEVLEVLKRYVDNDNLVVGAQSGSDRVLKLCHRGHTVEDVLRAVRLGIKAGFKMNVDFIFSLPGETEKDIKETEEFIVELVSLGARVHAHTFMPLPQTPFKRYRPREIDRRYTMLINRLLPKGVIFGDWQKQAAISKRIYQLLSA